MNFDEMLTTWRGQDERPLYGVNRDLLQLVLQHEQAEIRRKLRREHWSMYAASAVLLGFSGAFLCAFIYYGGLVWGTAVAGVGMAAIFAGAGSLWLSRRRQAQRERGFGNSLREEIRRNLALVDYQLSRHGRFESSLLAAAPVTFVAVLICWLTFQINTQSTGWFRVGGPLRTVIIFGVAVNAVISAIWSSHKTKQELLPRKRRLSELLELLDKSE